MTVVDEAAAHEREAAIRDAMAEEPGETTPNASTSGTGVIAGETSARRLLARHPDVTGPCATTTRSHWGS